MRNTKAHRWEANRKAIQRVALVTHDDPAPEAVGRAVLTWYHGYQRDLPWRRSKDPYLVWVSEVMLQQTQVRTMLPYFERWVQRFPTLSQLAQAEEQEVLALWQGLGYYSRARRLLSAARAVLAERGGKLPRKACELRRLPGIGPYTAGAIASIAFGEHEPVVDGNVARVLTRCFGRFGDPSRAPLRAELWQLARAVLVEGAAGDTNQALMELGSLRCSPRSPDCNQCPISQLCVAHARGLEEQLPELPPRPAATKVRSVAVVAVHEGRCLLFHAPRDARRWARLWQFPSLECRGGESNTKGVARLIESLAALRPVDLKPWVRLSHSVTRFKIELQAFRCQLCAPPGRLASVGRAPGDYAWVPLGALESYPMPAPHRRLRMLLAADFQHPAHTR